MSASAARFGDVDDVVAAVTGWICEEATGEEDVLTATGLDDDVGGGERRRRSAKVVGTKTKRDVAARRWQW